MIAKTGQLFSSCDLAREYRVTDADGRRPDWGRHKIDWSDGPEPYLEYFRAGGDIQARWLATLAKRTKAFHAKVPRRRSAKEKRK